MEANERADEIKTLSSAEYEILWGHIEYLQADNAALWDALTKLEESMKETRQNFTAHLRHQHGI